MREKYASRPGLERYVERARMSPKCIQYSVLLLMVFLAAPVLELLETIVRVQTLAFPLEHASISPTFLRLVHSGRDFAFASLALAFAHVPHVKTAPLFWSLASKKMSLRSLFA